MRLLKQSTAANVMVFMTDSADHVTGKTGLTLTITASKDGAAFASISPTVTDRGNGWYNLALTTSHTDTMGDLAVHVTATGADPTDFLCRVSARLVDDVLPTASYTAPDNTTVALIAKILRNKVVTNPSTGQIIVYDDDSVTPLLTGNLFEDVAGTQAYQGQGADRRDRMT